MKKIYILIVFFVCLYSKAQTPSADLLLVPHSVTSTQMNALTPTNGAMVYNSTENALYLYNNGSWIKHDAIANTTAINAGTNITITGAGTIADPYKISAGKSTLTDNGNGTYTFSNGIDSDVTFNHSVLQFPPTIISSSVINNCTAPATSASATFFLYGTSFTTDTTVSVTGGTVSNVTYIDPGTLQVTATAGSTGGKYNITATNSLGSHTLINGFYVQPYTATYNLNNLVIEDNITNNAGTYSGSGGSEYNLMSANEDFIEADSYGSFSANVNTSNKFVCFGLSNEPSTTNRGNIEYEFNLNDSGFFWNNFGKYTIRVKGTEIVTATSYSNGDIFEIKKLCNGDVQFYHNNSLKHTATGADKASKKLYADLVLTETGSIVSNLKMIR